MNHFSDGDKLIVYLSYHFIYPHIDSLTQSKETHLLEQKDPEQMSPAEYLISVISQLKLFPSNSALHIYFTSRHLLLYNFNTDTYQTLISIKHENIFWSPLYLQLCTSHLNNISNGFCDGINKWMHKWELVRRLLLYLKTYE